MILKTVRISSPSIHQPIDHILEDHEVSMLAMQTGYLVLCAKNSLADDERLQTEGVKVQGQCLQLSS